MPPFATPAVPDDWPLPLRLLIALATPDLPDGTDGLAGRMTQADWEVFADLAVEQHRLAAAIVPELAALGTQPPGPIATRLAAAARDSAMNALAQIAETRRITAAFAPLGVEPAVIKGWPLAEQLYGTPARRHSGDLDLMVPPEAATDCALALLEIGYEPMPGYHDKIEQARRPALRSVLKDLRFVHPVRDVQVEMHWRSILFHGWTDPLAGPAAMVRQDGPSGAVRRPADRANLAYLSVHGVAHRWNRLKWLADIDRLARRMGPAGVAAALDDDPVRTALPSVVQALTLARRLFGTPVPALPRARLEQTMLDVIRDDHTRSGGRMRQFLWRLLPALMTRSAGQTLAVVRHHVLRSVLYRLGRLPPLL